MISFTKTPQANLPNATFEYAWNGRVLTATLNHVERDDDGAVLSVTQVASEDFDFSGLLADEIAEVETQVIPINPVVSAYCDSSGDLYVNVVDWYDPLHDSAPEQSTEVIDEQA